MSKPLHTTEQLMTTHLGGGTVNQNTLETKQCLKMTGLVAQSLLSSLIVGVLVLTSCGVKARCLTMQSLNTSTEIWNNQSLGIFGKLGIQEHCLL